MSADNAHLVGTDAAPAMCAAYEILGIPSYHWIKMAENPRDMALWEKALLSKWSPDSPDRMPLDRTDFDHLMGHFGACTDQPAAVMAEELVAAYPEARVVLVERDVERWYESFVKTVTRGTDSPIVPFVTRIDRVFMAPMVRIMDLSTKYHFNVTAKRESWWCVQNPAFFEEWRCKAKAAYLAHNAYVKRVTPPERLLLFKPEQGWGPLCEFLGKPVPECSFPNLNDTEALNEKISLYIAEGMRRGLLDVARIAVSVAVLLSCAVVWCY